MTFITAKSISYLLTKKEVIVAVLAFSPGFCLSFVAVFFDIPVSYQVIFISVCCRNSGVVPESIELKGKVRVRVWT